MYCITRALHQISIALGDSKAKTIRKLQKVFKDNSMSVVHIKE